MTDWNGDGKHDWHDDYAINELIPDKSKGGGNRSGGNWSCSTVIIIALLLFELLKIIADAIY